MAYVQCEVSEGLRQSEATVAVTDIEGRKAYLRVERSFLYEIAGLSYLPVGVVYHDPSTGNYLIELPHEADSGVNRLWVSPRQVRLERREGAVA